MNNCFCDYDGGPPLPGAAFWLGVLCGLTGGMLGMTAAAFIVAVR